MFYGFSDTATARTSADGSILQPVMTSAYVLYYIMRDESVFALDSNDVSFSNVASVAMLRMFFRTVV